MNLVVGSGPAGVSCAKALLERGRPVTMLDAGLELEPENRQRMERLAALTPTDWPEEEKSFSPQEESPVPVKRVHGSDFFHRIPPGAPSLEQKGALALRSYAAGGLSRAWGATFVPFPEEEFAGWPVSLQDMAPHYAAVLKDVPWAAEPDGLYPPVGHSEAPLELSPQGEVFWHNLLRSRAELARAGFYFGRAGVAVRRSGPRGCRYCGACLRGCPYGSIYDAVDSLDDLRRRAGFSYVPGVVIRSAAEDGAGARVEGRRVADGVPVRFRGERVFLAAGALSTSQILMESLGMDGAVLSLKSSQAFWIPLWLSRRVRDATRRPAHALSQVYLLLKDSSVSSRTIQMQIYTYSDAVAEGLDHSFAGAALRLWPSLRTSVLERLSVLQVLFHSDDSDPLRLFAHRAADGLAFSLEAGLSKKVRRRIRRVLGAVWRSRRSFGAFPMAPFVRVSAPGQSFHTGGSFPMSASPGPGAADVLGRPAGWSRVHAVDAAVFPPLPAPPPTFTIMANARRIASLVP